MTELVAGAAAAARAYLRASTPGEDAVFADAAAAACGVAEAFLGAALPAAWEGVPGPVAQGLVLLIAHLVEHREGGVLPPAAVAALWRSFRVVRLAALRQAEDGEAAA